MPVKYKIEPLDFDRSVLKIEGYGYTLFFNDDDIKWLDEGGIPVLSGKGFPIMPSDRYASSYYAKGFDGKVKPKTNNVKKSLMNKPVSERVDFTDLEIKEAIDASLDDDLDFLNSL